MSGDGFSAPCSFLNVGQDFKGEVIIDGEYFNVMVSLLGCDIEKGHLCGELRQEGGGVKLWEGEIIDNQNYTFFESKWNVNWYEHRVRWREYNQFGRLEEVEDVERNGRVSLDLTNYGYMFMRWKEQSIYGIYRPPEIIEEPNLHYVCFRTRDSLLRTRYIENRDGGVAHKLRLEPLWSNCTQFGYNFATYEFQ